MYGKGGKGYQSSYKGQEYNQSGKGWNNGKRWNNEPERNEPVTEDPDFDPTAPGARIPEELSALTYNGRIVPARNPNEGVLKNRPNPTKNPLFMHLTSFTNAVYLDTAVRSIVEQIIDKIVELREQGVDGDDDLLAPTSILELLRALEEKLASLPTNMLSIDQRLLNVEEQLRESGPIVQAFNSLKREIQAMRRDADHGATATPSRDERRLREQRDRADERLRVADEEVRRLRAENAELLTQRREQRALTNMSVENGHTFKDINKQQEKIAEDQEAVLENAREASREIGKVASQLNESTEKAQELVKLATEEKDKLTELHQVVTKVVELRREQERDVPVPGDGEGEPNQAAPQAQREVVTNVGVRYVHGDASLELPPSAPIVEYDLEDLTTVLKDAGKMRATFGVNGKTVKATSQSQKMFKDTFGQTLTTVTLMVNGVLANAALTAQTEAAATLREKDTMQEQLTHITGEYRKASARLTEAETETAKLKSTANEPMNDALDQIEKKDKEIAELRSKLQQRDRQLNNMRAVFTEQIEGDVEMTPATRTGTDGAGPSGSTPYSPTSPAYTPEHE